MALGQVSMEIPCQNHDWATPGTQGTDKKPFWWYISMDLEPGTSFCIIVFGPVQQ